MEFIYCAAPFLFHAVLFVVSGIIFYNISATFKKLFVYASIKYFLLVSVSFKYYRKLSDPCLIGFSIVRDGN